ncbi:hypothetical protein ACFQ1L_26395 [Phytohabitans flavus]|uniref:hypothetical protein n=1 Tax=Phytohabitans flavus TaxID=1076124 RepID=UPI003629D2A5
MRAGPDRSGVDSQPEAAQCTGEQRRGRARHDGVAAAYLARHHQVAGHELPRVAATNPGDDGRSGGGGHRPRALGTHAGTHDAQVRGGAEQGRPLDEQRRVDGGRAGHGRPARYRPSAETGKTSRYRW